MKEFTEMNHNEINRAIKEAEETEWSPFALFCQGLQGYEFETKNGRQLDKWEVWAMGYQSVFLLFEGLTDIVVINRKSCIDVIW